MRMVLVLEESGKIQVCVGVCADCQPEQVSMGREGVQRLFWRGRESKMGGERCYQIGEEVVRSRAGHLD